MKETDCIIIPLGVTEEHGPHAPVSTDTWIGEHCANLLAERTGTPVAPVMPEVKPEVVPEETKPETPTVVPTTSNVDSTKVVATFAEKVITLSNVKPKLEFKLSKDFESVFIKVGGKNYLCANRLGIWVSEELEIEESGNYHVQVYGDKLLCEDDITFTKGIIENDLF
jgi:hypothetical protein